MSWDLQASAGAVGKSLLWRGAWSSASSYNPYDAVSASNGSSYISKTNNANKDPVSNPADWDVLAMASVGPIGAIVDFGGSVAPSGWLLCYGQAVSRTTYSALFLALGSGAIWGVGDGSTTFNVPDFRGRTTAGKDDMGGTAANRLQTAWGVNGVLLGAGGGTQSHTLTIAQIPAHNHNYVSPLSGSAWGSNTGWGAGGAFTGNAGSDNAHPNVQPTSVVNKIIFAGV